MTEEQRETITLTVLFLLKLIERHPHIGYAEIEYKGKGPILLVELAERLTDMVPPELLASEVD